jgi:hypothetical protein
VAPRRAIAILLLLFSAGLAGLVAKTSRLQESTQPGVRLVANTAERRVDVLVDGRAFTSYIYPSALQKPVLFPIRSASGTIITRGFPLEPRAGERHDHPHHVGLWFNYEDVNGVDFWNNSDAIAPAERVKMGVIRHQRVIEMNSGDPAGSLTAESNWVGPNEKILLTERTKFIFRGAPGLRIIDRIATLRAGDALVKFGDAKDGMLGLRVARALESPLDKPETLFDSHGNPTTVSATDNASVNGEYLSSEGKRGQQAWGTRGRWCLLRGRVGEEQVTIAILDHPGNPGFPTYWHARGYGLFAANPLGQKIFSHGKQTLNFSLAAGESATFRYRVIVFSHLATVSEAEAAYQQFAAAHQE